VAQVVYAAEALADLERIIEFLLEAAPESAVAALKQIRSAVTILEAHPHIGRGVEKHLRELVVTHGASGYLALYRHDAGRDLVRVLRIRHQREAGYRD
jgi:plasmid stabilization system protein ParE